MKSNRLKLFVSSLFILMCAFSNVMFAQSNKASKQQDADGKIIVKGAFADTLTIVSMGKNKVLGKNLFCYEFNGKENKTREFTYNKEWDNYTVFIRCNKDFTYLVLNSKEDIVIELTDKGYKISGANKDINHYYYDFTNLAYKSLKGDLRNQINRTSAIGKLPMLTPEDLYSPEKLKFLSTLEDKCLKQLKNAKIKDENIIAKQKLIIKYLEEDILLCDYVYSKFLKCEVPDAFLKRLLDINVEDDDFMDYSRRNVFLTNLSKFLLDHGGFEYDVINRVAKCAEKIKNQKAKELYIFDVFENKLVRKQTFNLINSLELCENLMTSEQGKKTYNYLLDNANKLLERMPKDGTKAFPFEYKDKDGNIVKLSDFRGKYVFLDIWATWCGPCKGQMPYMLAMEKEMKGKNIVFVSICVNLPKDKQAWIDYINTHEMSEVCLIANNALKDDMMVHYGINAIPRFILIDPNGNLVTSNAPQPRDAQFRKYIMDLVK